MVSLDYPDTFAGADAQNAPVMMLFVSSSTYPVPVLNKVPLTPEWRARQAFTVLLRCTTADLLQCELVFDMIRGIVSMQ